MIDIENLINKLDLYLSYDLHILFLDKYDKNIVDKFKDYNTLSIIVDDDIVLPNIIHVNNYIYKEEFGRNIIYSLYTTSIFLKYNEFIIKNGKKLIVIDDNYLYNEGIKYNNENIYYGNKCYLNSDFSVNKIYKNLDIVNDLVKFYKKILVDKIVIYDIKKLYMCDKNTIYNMIYYYENNKKKLILDIIEKNICEILYKIRNITNSILILELIIRIKTLKNIDYYNFYLEIFEIDNIIYNLFEMYV